MAGETTTQRGICLGIRPWSRTSHIVSWLTASGPITTVVKGAERPKSFFLGQYDQNYTCELLYYTRAKKDLHALKECFPLKCRDFLRASYRLAILADYFRELTRELAPSGKEAAEWYDLLERALDGLNARTTEADFLSAMLEFEISVLELAGFSPNFRDYDKNADILYFSVENGSYSGISGHVMRFSVEVAEALENPSNEKNPQILLDAARVIGVFYNFHLDCVRSCRRTVLNLIAKRKEQ